MRLLIGLKNLRDTLDVLVGDARSFRSIPLSVGLRFLDLRAPMLGHESALLKLGYELLVLLRPLAVEPTLREVLAIRDVVDLLHLPVDPAKAERFFQGFRCLERLRASCLAEDEPDTIVGRCIALQPFSELAPVGESQILAHACLLPTTQYALPSMMDLI